VPRPIYGTQSSGVTEVARAQQWARIPAQASALANLSGGQSFPPGDELSLVNTLDAWAFLSSPRGAAHGYGQSMPITVRTVAFGSIPVEVTAEIDQLRDAQDLPVPLHVAQKEEDYQKPQYVRPGFSGIQHVLPPKLTGDVTARILKASVDGVDVGLGGGCRTVKSFHLDLNPPAGVGYWADDPMLATLPPIGSPEGADAFAERGLYSVAYGGVMAGDVDLPAFAGCRTRTGEDLSRLFTAAVSGPGNHVELGLPAIAHGYFCFSKLPPSYILVGARAPYSGDPSDCNPLGRPAKIPLPTAKP